MSAGRWVAALMAVLAATLLTACSLWGPEGGPGGAGQAGAASPTPNTVAVAESGADGIQRVEIIVGDDLLFRPSRVRAHPGVIEFSFHNGGVTPHDVRVSVTPEAATGNLNRDDTKVLRFTIERPGTYPFPCLYHASSGMSGILEVT